MNLKFSDAQKIVAEALAYARESGFKPLGIAVLDGRGALKAYAAEDGASIGRHHIAIGKASGSIEMGVGSRTLAKRGREIPAFVNALGQLFPRGLIPVPGGVLVRDASGEVVGAVGISGEKSDTDERIAMMAIEAAGFTGDPGSD
jgi:uncharacterized protein GlcG (DUF336 family)